MLIAVGGLAAMGVTLGGLLGIAARYLTVEADPLEAELQAMLPGSQCGQCGFVGCQQFAAALAEGHASVSACIPGGAATAEALAKRLGVSLDGHDVAEDAGPQVAFINEDLCIGCLRCANDCGTDAIVGAAKQVHTVIADVCHACGKCVKVCPTEAIAMRPVLPTLATWHWAKPGTPLAAAK
ncbi:MAG: Electron transport complex protein rnfB [Pseudomonadota bacterium]|jgi:electron transport complex protein RnfB